MIAYAEKQVLFFILISFFLASCETVVQIDLPVEKPKLVVNSIFNADSILMVNVTQSRPSTEPGLNFKKVENAVVEVFKDKQSLGLLTYAGMGNYRASAKFPNEPNAEYSIKVKAADFPTAEATEQVPAKPVISSFKVSSDNIRNPYTTYKASFNLLDGNESNFYIFRAWLLYPNGVKSPLQCKVNNVLGQFSPLRSDNMVVQVFDDRSFNGKELTLDLEIYLGGSSGSYKVLLELRRINQSYFDYLYSVKRTDADIPLLEPENLPLGNNIKNGLGIFAPYNASGFTFDVVR